MPEDEETWLGDDEDEELPILSEQGVTQLPPAPTGKRHRLKPTGNVRTSMTKEKRRQVLAEATGTAFRSPDQWREELDLGNRERAASALSTRRQSNGSGFGLA